MSKTKQIHFYGKVLLNRPFDFAGMIGRRLVEAASEVPQGTAVSHFGDVRFPVDLSIHAITRKYYFHTHEMFLERIFKEHLKPGSIFIDIGANLGYWSAFAASLVGPEGEVHAFEPVPRFFESVARLQRENPQRRIFANNVACGAQPGSVEMQVIPPSAENYQNFDTNIGSSSALPGFLDHQRSLVQSIKVDVIRFDDYLENTGIDLDRVGLIKIDVEGFESYCFDGMQKVLNKKGRKIPILCEVLTDTKRHELLDGPKIVRRLEGHGYSCLDATTLAPADPSRFAFEENIICV